MAIVTDSRELRAVLRSCRTNFVFATWFHTIATALAFTYILYMINVFDRAVPSRSYDTLTALFIGACIALVFKGLFSYVRTNLLIKATLRLDKLLAGRTFRALMEKSAAQRDETGAQPLRDLMMFRQFFCGGGAITAMSVPWVGVFLAVLYLMYVWVGVLATVFLVINVILAIIQMAVTRGTIEAASAAMQATLRIAEANVRSADAAVGMGLLPGLVQRWLRSNDVAVAAEAQGGITGAKFSSFEETFGLFQKIAIITAVAIGTINGQLNVGVAFSAVIIFGMMMGPVMQVLHAWESYLGAKEAGERLASLYEQFPAPATAMPLPRPKGELAIRNVSYMPRGAPKPILRGITFGALAGTSLAIVGPIGSGKSTLVRLIMGVIRPSAGEIRLDGVELWSWDRADLGRHIGYLPQDIGLLTGSVAENIGRFGTFGEREVVEAAVRAGCHEMILKLPQGYDTPVGEGGHPLSGGQKQLIGLARAVIGRPAFVVLDEPNAALDGPGEAALVACIAALKEMETTVVMVSHRPTLVQHLDRVALLRDGELQIVVTAEEFMKRSGRPLSLRMVKDEA